MGLHSPSHTPNFTISRSKRQLSSETSAVFTVPPCKKLKRVTADDVLARLAQDALHVMSHHPLISPSLSSNSLDSFLDAPQSPHSFLNRAGIRNSSSIQIKACKPLPKVPTEPIPLPQPLSPKRSPQERSFHTPPSAQPARRRSFSTNSQTSPSSLHLHLTPCTARAVQSLLDLTR